MATYWDLRKQKSSIIFNILKVIYILNNHCVKERTKKGIRICLETNGNENTAYQNLRDVAKAIIPRGKFILIDTYIEKEERSQSNLTLHLKELEKDDSTELSEVITKLSYGTRKD